MKYAYLLASLVVNSRIDSEAKQIPLGAKLMSSHSSLHAISIYHGGRPIPYLKVTQTSKDKCKSVHRYFRNSLYKPCDWIYGCDVTNVLYCFVYLLFLNDLCGAQAVQST